METPGGIIRQVHVILGAARAEHQSVTPITPISGKHAETGHIQLYRQPILAAAERARRVLPDGSRYSFWKSDDPYEACCLAMVLRHEMVHAACHLGRTSDGQRWRYEAMPTGVHELLAEFFKDKAWSDPLTGLLRPNKEKEQSWYRYWHEQQMMLPPGNPYRQHLPLREVSPEPLQETVTCLMLPNLVTAGTVR